MQLAVSVGYDYEKLFLAGKELRSHDLHVSFTLPKDADLVRFLL